MGGYGVPVSFGFPDFLFRVAMTARALFQ